MPPATAAESEWRVVNIDVSVDEAEPLLEPLAMDEYVAAAFIAGSSPVTMSEESCREEAVAMML
jgi:hypothetical protein